MLGHIQELNWEGDLFFILFFGAYENTKQVQNISTGNMVNLCSFILETKNDNKGIGKHSLKW